MARPSGRSADGAAERFANRRQRVSRYAGGVAFDSLLTRLRAQACSSSGIFS